jgi:hypothetical protein
VWDFSSFKAVATVKAGLLLGGARLQKIKA